MEELFIGEDFSGGRVEAENIKVMAVLGRGGEPDLVVHDDGRREAEEGNPGLPLHVLGFAPFEGQSGGAGVTVLTGTAVVGPVVGGGERKGESEAGEEDGAGEDARFLGKRGFHG